MLPAYAGMIPYANMEQESILCAPRVCGDDPRGHARPRTVAACSPRMRG